MVANRVRDEPCPAALRGRISTGIAPDQRRHAAPISIPHPLGHDSSAAFAPARTRTRMDITRRKYRERDVNLSR